MNHSLTVGRHRARRARVTRDHRIKSPYTKGKLRNRAQSTTTVHLFRRQSRCSLSARPNDLTISPGLACRVRLRDSHDAGTGLPLSQRSRTKLGGSPGLEPGTTGLKVHTLHH